MKKIATLALCTALSTMIGTISFAETIIFKDVAYNHWAINYIYNAQARKIINGYEDETFKPENKVKTGEFIKMVAMAYWPKFDYETAKLNLEKNNEYVDEDENLEEEFFEESGDPIIQRGENVDAVNESEELYENEKSIHWAMPYVESIDRIILNKYNYDDETLERVITRAEAARILCVFYIETHKDANLEEGLENVLKFADESEIVDEIDRLAIDNCIRFGLINGFEDNTFRPLDGLTRAQAAKILCIATDGLSR